MTDIQQTEIERALSEISDPETGRDIVHMEQIRDISISPDSINVTLALATHSAPLWDEVAQAAREKIVATIPATKDIDVNVNVETLDRPPSPIGQIGLKAKTVIAIASGKGGVGKSTVAAAVACGLQRSGCQVGLMDADVYGPSIPHLFGLSGRPAISEDKKIVPADCHGLKVISMGLLVPADEPVVWRGPMLHGAITQFLRDTAWGNLDYLIIDMPPGTGDIALTLSQLLPLTGAVVVCTPQDVALIDATKAIGMFRKVNIPVIGMVENMSGFQCDCGKRHDIFGKGGARDKASELEIELLAEIPITTTVRTHGDQGQMFQAFDDPATAQVLLPLSYQLVKSIATANATNPPMPELPVL